MGYEAIPIAVLGQALTDLTDDSDPVQQTKALDWVLHSPMFDWWVAQTESFAELGADAVRSAFLRAAGWGDRYDRTDNE